MRRQLSVNTLLKGHVMEFVLGRFGHQDPPAMYQILYKEWHHPLVSVEILSHDGGVSLWSLILFLHASDAKASQLTARFYCKHSYRHWASC